MENPHEEYTKVHVLLPNHWMVAEESMFGVRLGNGNYRIENIPFFCYGLNLHDVVSVKVNGEGIPEIEKLVEPSGNSTIRIFFNEKFTDAEILKHLETIKQKGCNAERGNFNLFSVNVPDNCDYNGLVNELSTWEEQDILSFETGECRLDGTFDDIPQHND